MMRELGLQPSVSSLARHYGDAVDHWVIDARDASHARALERLGKRVTVCDTMMTTRHKGAALARRVIAAARQNIE
jgi:LPPG:FO 2-phospho-L-lactate transferase